MPTSFDVLFLGTGSLIDQTEGDTTSENASSLVNTSYGSAAAPLYAAQQTLSPVGSPGSVYQTDNNVADTSFDVDGTTYTFDGIAQYTATITYNDGTTAQVEVLVAQTTTGELFLVPHAAGDENLQAPLEVKPIESITLDALTSNDENMAVDRLESSYPDAVVDGTSGNDTLIFGTSDADGDRVDGGDNTINGGDGNDLIEGAGGADTISGGADNDTIYGDSADGGSGAGYFEPVATGNMGDLPGVSTSSTRAVELVTLANGDLIMITSERSANDDGIATFKIDNDPSSSTYGQLLTGRIDQIESVSSGDGYDQIEDLAATTLDSGETYVFTADDESIGVAQVNSDGTLTQLPSITTASGSSSEIQELSIIEVGGEHFLLMLDGGSANSLTSYQINSDGTLTQTDIELDGSGSDENYLNNSSTTVASMLESFTNSAGETFVITGGHEHGVSLWTLDGTGDLSFQNARGDNRAGAGENDPQGNDLGRDVISPSSTGLLSVDAAAFAEIDGETYIFMGGVEDDITIFRVDADTVNGDGTFDLTLVGQLENAVSDISTMAVIDSEEGPRLIVGGEQSSLEFYSISVGSDGSVSVDQAGSFADGTRGATELDDSESIDVEGGILVSASDNDNGVTVFDTGTTGEASNTSGGNDVIDGGAGDDFIVGGGGQDTVTGGTGNDTIYGDGDFVRESLNWENITSTQVNDGFTTNTGNVDVTFTSPTQTGATLSTSNSTDIYTDTIDDGAAEADTNSVFSANLSNSSSLGEYQWDFSEEVTNVSFVVTDLDALENIQVLAFDADNNPIEVVLSPGSNLTVSDTNGDGIDDFVDGSGSGDNTDPSHAVTVTIPGPVSRIEVDHTLDSGGGGLGINFSEMFFDVPTESTSGENDNLSGGEGDDSIYGDGGDDIIDGGADNDTLVGGTGDDTITGGTGNDTIYGDLESTSAIGQELLSNPDFAGNINGWTIINPTGSSSPAYSSDVDAVRINQGDEDAGGDGIAQTVETQPGGTYDVQVDIGQNGGNAGVHDILVEVIDENGNVLDSQTVQVSNTSTSATVNLSFTATTENTTLSITNPTSTATVGTDPLVESASFVQTALPPSTAGDDTIDGGEGADIIDAGEGSDTILLNDNFGNDTITAGEDPDGLDIDELDASGLTTNGLNVQVTGNETGTASDGTSTATFSEVESFTLTEQDDIFDGNAAPGDYTVDAGGGDDTLTDSSGTNDFDGGEGSDTFNVGYGTTTITGGEDPDGNDVDTLSFAEANDGANVTLTDNEQGTYTDNDGDSGSFTGIEDFELSGQDDVFDASAATTEGVTVDGGAGADNITGSGADDTIDGGAGDDTLTGGQGNDTFTYSGGLDTITDFGAGDTGPINDGDSTNNDTINLSGYYDHLFELWADQEDDGILNQSNTTDTQGNAVDYSDNTQFGAGEGVILTGASGDPTSLNQDNTGVVCFTPGTLIDTVKGPVPVEMLRVGDMVVTRDNGVQPIRWLGARRLGRAELDAHPRLRPIFLKQGFFGLKQDLIVSPQHGVLVRLGDRGGDEKLVRAKHLAGLKGGAARVMNGARYVTYIHLLFDDHQVIRANGGWSESLYPGPMALRSLPPEAITEVLELFPSLDGNSTASAYGPSARGFAAHKTLPSRLQGMEHRPLQP